MMIFNGSITRPAKLKALKRWNALICSRREHGADFVLPIALSYPTDRNMDSLAVSDVTGIFLQVKNWQRSFLPSSQVEEDFFKLDDFAMKLVEGAP